MLQDLRYAFRQCTANPGFALTAVISLALGIGAATAVFSVVYAALIDPYPYPAVDRIVRLVAENTRGGGEGEWISLNGSQVRQVQRVPVVASVIAMGYQALTLTGHDVPENVNAIYLISNAYQDLGVPPLLGRGIGPADAPDGQEPQPVVFLSYKFWRRRYFSNPDVLGKTLELDHKSYTIVGVAAPRFTWYSADLYLPLKLIGDPAKQLIVDLRLKPGVSYSAADSALQPLVEQFAREMPKHFPEHLRVKVEGLNKWVDEGIGATLYLLLGAVALLLAIGCANVSILLMARGTARRHELSIRIAMGARGRRIVRQLLTEAMLLSAAGVAVGVALSFGILAGIEAVLPPYAFAPEVVIRLNLPVLVSSGVVAAVAGLLFGLWPALRISRLNAQPGGRRVAGSIHGRRTHNALIAGQIALTLLLLAGAGSAMHEFVRLIHQPLGYDPHNVLSIGIPLHDNTYTTWAGRAAYFEQLRARVAETPGVTLAAISSNATPPRNGWNTRFEILGKPSLEQLMGSLNLVNPGYFEALRIPLVAGRVWTETENAAGAHVAVVNRTLVRRFFPDAGAIGRFVRVPGAETRPPAVLTVPGFADLWLEVVGIVEDARNDGLRDAVKPGVYVPYTLAMSQGTQILVRSRVPPLTLVHALRKQLAAVNPEQQAYADIEDLEGWIRDLPEWQREHLTAWIFGTFAALALVLAAVGLYSVVSYTVAQRTSEFGIRMALGARRRHVLGLVFGSTLKTVAAGMAAGLLLAVALGRYLTRWTNGDPRQPMILPAGVLLLAAVAVVACAIPAWRASEADPAAALRSE